MLFKDRTQAGQQLAVKLQDYRSDSSLTILAIPRGGVVVGRELADYLSCPLDVIVTKKIPAPGSPELAIGAVGPAYWGSEPVIDEGLAKQVGADEEYLKLKIENLKLEAEEREKKFRRGRTAFNLKDKTVIITDDGVATGATMKMAIELVRQQNPKKIIVAVPVIAKDTLPEIEALADEVIYLDAPAMFFAVGQFYQEFEQVTDEEVIRILNSK